MEAFLEKFVSNLLEDHLTKFPKEILEKVLNSEEDLKNFQTFQREFLQNFLMKSTERYQRSRDGLRKKVPELISGVISTKVLRKIIQQALFRLMFQL